MNVCLLSGRLVRDVEVRFLSDGTPLSKFAIAVEYRYQKGTEWVSKAHFFDCVLWGKRGEFFASRFKRGDTVTLNGRIEQETWKDKTTGAPRSKVVVCVEDFTLPNRDVPQFDENSVPHKSSGSRPRLEPSAEEVQAEPNPLDEAIPF